jgi:hypothetical protein
MYSVGKIPGGYKRREGRASDKAILTSRLIDRPLRPLFPKGFFNDVTVVATALSVDPEIAIERFISQSPKELLLAPDWGLKNFEFVAKIDKRMQQRNTFQGRLYQPPTKH